MGGGRVWGGGCGGESGAEKWAGESCVRKVDFEFAAKCLEMVAGEGHEVVAEVFAGEEDVYAGVCAGAAKGGGVEFGGGRVEVVEVGEGEARGKGAVGGEGCDEGVVVFADGAAG